MADLPDDDLDLMGRHADVRVVADLLKALRAAWRTILREYGEAHARGVDGRRIDVDVDGGVRFVDGWGVAHNFFKRELDHIVAAAKLEGEEAAQVYLSASETFAMAMQARARRARQHARERRHGT